MSGTVTVKAGRVPGSIIALVVREGTTVFDVMKLAAEEIGKKRELGRPAFNVTRGDYTGDNGRTSVDVPQMDGQILATKSRNRYVDIRWDTPVTRDCTVLVVPKIQGNQFTVNVARVPGALEAVAIYDGDDPEGGPDAGTVAAALVAAGIELTDDEEVLVNGDPADTDDRLDPDDTITVQLRETEEEEENEGGGRTPEEDEEDSLETRVNRATALMQHIQQAVSRYRRAQQELETAQAALEAILGEYDL